MGPDLEIECPHCRQNFHQNVKEITVRGKRSCPVCGHNIEFTGPYIFQILRKLDRSRSLDLSGWEAPQD